MKNLEKLVKIASNKNKEDIINYVYGELNGKVKNIEIIISENGCKSIVFGLNSYLKNICPIVLSGHLDTVDPNFEFYNTDPYTLTEKDGKFYGLGSIDMKSFMAVILDNLESLKQFKTPIIGCFTTDEETTIECVLDIIEFLKSRNITPIFSIIGEPTKSKFCLSSKGCKDYKLTFKGKACHSSVLQNGINAISAAAKLVTFLEEVQKGYKTLTSNVGVIKGGEASNKVADLCEIVFDARTNSKIELDSFEQKLKEKLSELKIDYKGLEISEKVICNIPPLFVKNEQKIKSIATKLGICFDEFSGACEAGYYTAYSGDAVIFGVGDLMLAHKPNEFVELSEYKEYSSLLLKVIGEIEKEYK